VLVARAVGLPFWRTLRGRHAFEMPRVETIHKKRGKTIAATAIAAYMERGLS
jgi:hypothetical protein